MQFQSDILGVDVLKPEIEELSAQAQPTSPGLKWEYGRILMRSPSCGRPRLTIDLLCRERRTELYAGWKDAVQRALTAELSCVQS